MRSRYRAKALMALAACGFSLAGAAAIRRLARFEVIETSMQPALQPGDYLLTVMTRSLSRGDVVVYPDPALSTRSLIKRVVALPGERITIASGQVAIDGTVLSEPWATGPTLPDGEWTNPPNTVFTLGDNRLLSSGDGRATGPIRLDLVHRVLGRYWPLDSFGRI